MPFSFCHRKFTLFCWQSSAIILVVFALLVSLIRGLLPQLHEVRQELVDYVESQYHVQVQVDELAAEWQAFGPALTVKRLVLPPQDNLPITLLVDQVHVKLDFWDTLIHASPRVENVIFDKVELAVNLDSFVQESLSDNSADNTAPMNTDWLYQLLLEQLERFSIGEAKVKFNSQYKDYRPIYLSELRWRNNQAQHKGKGTLRLDNLAGELEQVSVRMDLIGDGSEPDSLTGELYLAAKALDLGEWASRQQNPFAPEEKLPLAGVVNLQAWLTMANRSFSSGQVVFEPSWLEWQLDDEPQKFEVTDGSLLWFPNENGWQVQSQGLDFVTNGRVWPELAFYFVKRQSASFAYLNQLDPSLVLPFLPLVPGVDLDALYTWQAMQPKGSIGPLRVYGDRAGSLRAQVALNGISWKNVGGIPGSKPIGLDIGWQGDELTFALPKQAYELDFGKGFKAPLRFDGQAFGGSFNFTNGSLSVEKLKLANDDISIEADSRLLFSENLHLALSAAVELKKASNADRYFPLMAMSSELVDYLDGAIKRGQSDDAKVIWHGELANFPYDDNSGVFQAGFHLDNALYEFEPGWPAVDDIRLYGLFENIRMDLWVERGQLKDVAADGAHVFIPELSEFTTVKVQADLATQAEAATQVIQASPLADSVGATLNVVQVSGPINGELDLTIPLYDGGVEDIRGKVAFENNPVYISKPGLQLETVTGQIQFVNDVVEGEGVTAKLFEQPLTLSFDTSRMNQDFGLNIKLAGNWQLESLPESLSTPLETFYQGSLDWQGGLTMIFDESGYRLQAQLASDLQGVALNFPSDFGKEQQSKRDLRIELIGDNKQSSLGIKLDDKAEFWGGFNFDAGNELQHYDLLLGRLFRPGDKLYKQEGHILVDMPEAEFLPWTEVINAFVSDTQDLSHKGNVIDDSAAQEVSEGELQESTNTDSELASNQIAAFPDLIGININLDRFDVAGQLLSDVTLLAAPSGENWRIITDSDLFKGQIDFFPNWYTQGLKLNAERLYLNSQNLPDDLKDTQQQATQVLAELPPLAVEVEDFRVNDLVLGQLVLQGNPEAKDYKIQTLSLSTPEVNLKGSGVWHNQHGENTTQFDLTLTASKFDHISAQLGIDPGLKDAPLELTAQVGWKGAPYGFTLEELNGKVGFELGKGVLSEVSDKGARIFSLFSLDSILRKLSLDFSDVFGKGLFFNTFSGDLVIDHGVVKTTNTEIDAVAGDINVRGFTDLRTESLNYDIRFVPKLASSVPTVVLLTTSGWTLGLGAFALSKVLEPVIEVISEIRFRLTGTLTDPKVEELERKSKEIEIPESVLPKEDKSPDDKAPATEESDGTKGEQTPADIADTIEAPTPALVVPIKKQQLQDTELESGRKKDQTNKEARDNVDAIPKVQGIDIHQGKAPAIEIGPEKATQGDKDASQPVAMPEQSRYQSQPPFYRVAA